VSAIVSTFVFAERDLAGLREAAHPRRRLFRKAVDSFADYFRAHARPLAVFDGSGFVFNPLLVLLEKRGVPVLKSKHDELAKELQSVRGVLLYLIFTPEHREAALGGLLALGMSDAELEKYYEEFNEDRAPGAGEAMRRAIQFLVSSIEAVPDDGIVLFEMA
jgi:hypothetical protein